MGKSHLSVSQLKSILRCGESFRLEKLNFPQLPAVYLAGGSAFHSASERLDITLFEGLPVDEDKASNYWFDAWDYQYNKALAVESDADKWRKGGRASKALPNREDVTFWYEKGREMLLAYFSYRQASDWEVWELPDGSPAIEVPTVAILDGVEVMGFQDRVMVTGDGELVVRDIKTGKQPPDAIQLGTYAEMLWQTFGVRAAWGDYYMSREARPSTPIDLTPYSHEYLLAEYGKIDKMRKQGLYLVNEGQHCIACGVKAGCRLKGTPSVIAEYRDKVPEYA
jgi:putative RecB family exonuclease